MPLKFNHEGQVGLTPLTVPSRQVVHNLLLQHRISSAKLQPLHRMLMLKIKVRQSPRRALQQVMQVQRSLGTADQPVKRNRDMLLVFALLPPMGRTEPHL